MKGAKMKTSERFMDAVCDQHSPCMTCEFCGRTHFTPDDEGYDLLASKAMKQPDKYIEYPSGSTIAWGVLDGKQYVYECPCDSGERYEQWLITHRMMIAKFLKEWAKGRAQRANYEAAMLGVEAESLR
jgi:hypothetical protein